MTTSSNEPGEQESTSESGAQESTSEPGVIEDEQLPEDLQPTDDNPLAKDPPPDGGDGQNAESNGS